MRMSKPEKKGLVPERRFPEFKDTGEWKNELFEKIYSFKTTNSFSRDTLNYKQGTVKNIHYGDIHTKFSTLFDIEKEYVPYINPTESLRKIKPDSYCVEGDMIFADASEDKDDIGKSIEIVSLNNEKVVSGLHTLLARQIKKKLVTGFGGYLFKSNRIREQIKKESQGTKVLGISGGRLSSISVVYPADEKEQKKIADCLTSVDELITAQTQKLSALKTHKSGLMQELFPAKGETVPKRRFPEFREKGEWANKELGSFIKERTTFANQQLPLYSLTIEDGVTPKSERYERAFLVKDKGEAYKVVEPNDFAFNPMNLRFGAIAMHSGSAKVALSKYYNIFYCDKSVDSRFCEAYFKSTNMISLYDDIATGSLIEKRRVHFSAFVKLNLRFPRLSEQQKIAECLTSIDELISAQTQKIEALKAHKKGLMQQLFPAMDEVSD